MRTCRVCGLSRELSAFKLAKGGYRSRECMLCMHDRYARDTASGSRDVPPGTLLRCKKCGETRDRDQFPLSTSGYRRGECKPCKNGRRVPQSAASRWAEKRAVRDEVFTAMGGECECCGEGEYAFLTVDHSDGGGAAHRLAMSPDHPRQFAGVRMYRWIKHAGYPAGFRLLCANCQMASARLEGCPHGGHTD